MAIKIDLEKAYDRVRWDFIDAPLQVASIPAFLRNVIISSISNSTMQVLWNSVPTPKFRPTRGLDKVALFPHIFLCYAWNDWDTLSTLLSVAEIGDPFVSLARDRPFLTSSLRMISLFSVKQM